MKIAFFLFLDIFLSLSSLKKEGEKYIYKSAAYSVS